MSPSFPSSSFYNFPGKSSKPRTHECPPSEALRSKGGFPTFPCAFTQFSGGKGDGIQILVSPSQPASEIPKSPPNNPFSRCFSSASISGSLHFLVFSSLCLILKACVLTWSSWKEKVPGAFRRAVASRPQPHPPATAFFLWKCRLKASSSN